MKIKFHFPSVTLNTLFQNFSNNDSHLLSCFVLGDLLGAVDTTGHIKYTQEQSLAFLQTRIKSFGLSKNPCLMDFVGNFSVILVNHTLSEISIFTSSTGRSIYLIKKSEQIAVLTNDEKYVLTENKNSFTYDVIHDITLSHQLVLRTPFSFFGLKHVLRNPASHLMVVNFSNFTHSHTSCLYGLNNSPDQKTVSLTLSSILRLYAEKYKSQLGLSYSGGLDSSCLASLLASNNISIPFIHVDYKGSFSNRSKIAHCISNYLGFSTFHLPKFSRYAVEQSSLPTISSLGLHALPNVMYAGNPTNRFVYTNIPKYLITGQGADSVYIIDSYAPSTETIGIQRLKHILSSYPYRLSLCEENISHSFGSFSDFAEYLHNDNVSLSKHQLTEIIRNQCCSLDEHVPYTKKTIAGSQSYSQHRLRFIFKPIINIMRESIGSGINSYSSLYRYIKWTRSLINVPEQYASMSNAQNVIRLTPFLESPFVRLFFDYEITPLESVNIKDILEQVFSAASGISHRQLVEAFISRSSSSSDFGIKAGEEADSNNITQFLKFSSNKFMALLNDSDVYDRVPKSNLNISNFLKLSAIL